MPWTAAAIVGSAALSYSASKSAGAAQSKSADKASDVQLQMYNQTRTDQADYRELGKSALAQLGYGIGNPLSSSGAPLPQNRDNFDEGAYLAANPEVGDPNVWRSGDPFLHWQVANSRGDKRAFTGTQEYKDSLLGSANPNEIPNGGIGLGEFNKVFSMADYKADPGYQFRLDQGTQALERSAAARGGLLSGGNLKDLTDYQQGAASQEYGNAYNRFNNNQSSRFNRLAALAGVGQTANNTLAGVGQNTANQIGSNLIGSGNAQAAGIVGGANAINNGVSQGISAYQTNQYLKAIK